MKEVQIEVSGAEQQHLAGFQNSLKTLMRRHSCKIEVNQPLGKVIIRGHKQSGIDACVLDITRFLATGSFLRFQEVWECPREFQEAVRKELNDMLFISALVTVMPVQDDNQGPFRVQISSSDEMFVELAKRILNERVNPTHAEKVCPLCEVMLGGSDTQSLQIVAAPTTSVYISVVSKNIMWVDVCYAAEAGLLIGTLKYYLETGLNIFSASRSLS